MCHDGPCSYVQAQQLPADRFVARATAADLPNSHDGVVFLGEANSVNLDRSSSLHSEVQERGLNEELHRRLGPTLKSPRRTRWCRYIAS
jgi:hypothetical protein